MSINDFAIQERDTFFEEHGDCVLDDGYFIFEDGALAENNGMGLLSPPSDDDCERQRIITRYHEIVAQRATQEFDSFKSWLQGSGQREESWAKLYTSEDQLAHLRELLSQARRCRARYARHRRELQRMQPDWLRDHEQADIEHQSREAAFASEVDDLKL